MALQQPVQRVLFLQVNLPSGDFYRIQKAAAAADFWTQLLCVAADRNPSLGMYYPGKLAACADAALLLWLITRSACGCARCEGPAGGSDRANHGLSQQHSLQEHAKHVQNGPKAAVRGLGAPAAFFGAAPISIPAL
jgi:hypothetical protein